MNSRTPALCFEPVFKPHKQDLCFYKGADFVFSLLVTDYSIDFRGASFAMEIRPPDGDIKQIKNILGSATVSTSVIKLEFEKLDCSGECKADRDIKKLASLPISEGDFVSLEGSGIELFPVLSVTANSLLVQGQTIRDVSKARVFFRYKSWASFTVLPSFTETEVITESLSAVGSESLQIQSLSRGLSKGDKLVFADGINNDLVVTLTQDAVLGSKVLNVEPLTTQILGNAIATLDAFAVILTSPALAGSNTLIVPSITAAIPSGTVLNFSRRTSQGWEYLGEAEVIDTAPKGSTTISVALLEQDLPIGAIAYFGSTAFNTLTIGITADDTRKLHLKKYSYDLIVRLADGEKIPIMKGDINFDGYVSDFI